MISQTILILLLFLLLTPINTEQPPTIVTLPNTFYVKMHSQSATVIDAYHPLGLTNTTSIISDGKPFTLCQVKPANLSSKLLSMKMFKERNSRVNGPIFKFEDLKHLKNAIDLAEHNKRFYVVFEEGVVEVYERVQGDLKSVMKLTRTDGLGFEEGNFASNGQELMYVTDSEAWLVGNSLVQLKEYRKNDNFQMARLSGNNLLVALGSDGFAIYPLKDQSLQPPKGYKFDFFKKQVFIVDSTWLNTTHFLLLDQLTGASMYSLTPSGIQPLDAHHINATNCENLIYSQNLIFLTCPQVIVYELATSKRFDLPETDIYPEDIVVVTDELERLHVVLVGDAHMAYYHDLRRLPLYGALYTHVRVVAGERNRFVGISNYIITEFEISPKFEAVSCGQQHLLTDGIYNFQIHAVAQCNPTFLQQHNLYQAVNQSKSCEYITKVQLDVWSDRKISWVTVSVLLVVVGWCFAVFIIWCCVKNCRLEREYNTLEEEIGSVVSERQQGQQEGEKEGEKEKV